MSSSEQSWCGPVAMVKGGSTACVHGPAAARVEAALVNRADAQNRRFRTPGTASNEPKKPGASQRRRVDASSRLPASEGARTYCMAMQCVVPSSKSRTHRRTSVAAPLPPRRYFSLKHPLSIPCAPYRAASLNNPTFFAVACSVLISKSVQRLKRIVGEL